MEDENIKSPKLYEMSFLVKDENDALHGAELIKKFSGTVVKEPVLRRIALSYPIKKHTSAVFGFLTFHMAGDSVKAMEHDLRTDAVIIRALIISIVPKKERAKRDETRGMPYRPAPVAPARAMERKSAPPAALSNEALTKKIEEILQ